ncbi:MAG: copper resistance D family protein, partial [Gemmatimonadales bacterium]
ILFLAGLSFIRSKPAGWNVVHAGVLALLLATPVTGHAVAGTWGWKIEVPLHALHLAGSGLWLGTLLCIIGVGYPVARLFGEPEAGRLIGNMVHRFNPLALTGAAVVVAGGGLLSFAYVGLIEQNWGTAYGVTLLVKIGLLLIVLLLGAYNWRRLRPRLGLPAGSESLRRTATVELIIGSLVLLATAILVHLPAPRV